MRNKLAAATLVLALTSGTAWAQATGVEDGTGDCPACNQTDPAKLFLGLIQKILSPFGTGGSVDVRTRTGAIESRVTVESEKNDCDFTTVSFRSALALVAGGEFEKEIKESPFKLEIEAKLGHASTTELKLPNSTWSDFRHSNGRLPNIFDPLSIPPGGSITLKEEDFVALGMEASYRALTFSNEVTKSKGNVVSVVRGMDGKVRVLVGPEEAVNNEAMFGVGFKGLSLGITSTRTLETGKVKAYEFDPTSAADRTAMQDLLLHGTSPRESSTVDYIDLKEKAGIGLEAGPLSAGINLGSSHGEVRIETRPDGSKKYEGRFEFGKSTLIDEHEVDAAGNPVGDATSAVLLPQLSKYESDMLGAAYGTNGPGKRAQITLSGNDWQQWVARAQETLKRNPWNELARTIVEAKPTSNFEVAHLLYLVLGGPNNFRFDWLADMGASGDKGRRSLPSPLKSAPCETAHS